MLNRYDLVTTLVGAGVDVNAQNGSPMMLAAEYSTGQIVQLLIQTGANTSTENYDCWTPLDYAIQNGNNQTITVLEEYHAKYHDVQAPQGWFDGVFIESIRIALFNSPGWTDFCKDAYHKY